MKKLIDFVKLFLGLPLSFVALFFITRLIFSHKETILLQLQTSNLLLLFLGMLSFFIFFLLRTYVWQQILKEKGHLIPLVDVSYLWMSSEIKRYVPGNIWSFLSRMHLFSEKNVPKQVIITSLITEAEFLLISCILLSLSAYSFIFYNILQKIFFLPSFFIPLVFFIVGLATVLFICSSFLKTQTNNRYLLLFFNILPNFPLPIMIAFLLLSLAYVFFFSFGSYLTMTAVIPLSPLYLWTFIGFFLFSYLIGYFSFITPMGLGVREAVLTLGLSQFTIATLAGFAAVFVRAIFIVSELLFFLATFLWQRVQKNKIAIGEHFIAKHKFFLLVCLGIFVYIVYFSSASFLRHENFFTGRFDLGNMDQTVWNTKEGRIFLFTNPDGVETVSRLAFHADFILVLLAPFYWFWSDPRMLLFLQTIVIASGSIFVYLLGKNVLNNQKIASILALLYLLNPALHWTNLYDFHAVTFATTFLLAAFYFLYIKKYYAFLFFSLLAAFTKEQLWAIIGLFGLYIFFKESSVCFFKKCVTKLCIQKQMFGLSIFVISCIIFYSLVWVAIPQTRGANHFALSYFSEFGSSPTNIVKNFILSPHKIIATLGQDGRMLYLHQLFSPLGYLPILSPLILIFALPDLLINTLSNNSNLHQIYYQYSANITPFLFIATIFSLKSLQNYLPRVSVNFYIVYLIATALYSAYMYGPLPGTKNPNIDMFLKQNPDKVYITSVLRAIPKEYRVAATNNIGAHLTQREHIYTIPFGIEKADVIVFLHGDTYARPSPQAQKKLAENLKNSKQYKILAEKEDFIVLEKIRK